MEQNQNGCKTLRSNRCVQITLRSTISAQLYFKIARALALRERSRLDFRNGASSIAPGNHQERRSDRRSDRRSARRSDRRSDCSSKNVRRSNALEIAFALQGRSARKVCFQNCFKRHNSKRASKRLSFKASFTFCKKRNGGRRPALEIVLLRRQTFY